MAVLICPSQCPCCGNLHIWHMSSTSRGRPRACWRCGRCGWPAPRVFERPTCETGDDDA